MNDQRPPSMGFFRATRFGVGATLGGGVVALAGVGFAHAGPAFLVACLLNGVIAGLTALSFAEMATAFPENGGPYTFAKKVFTVRAAFAIGWILALAFITAAVLYALGFATFAATALAAAWQAAGGLAPAWLSARPGVLVLAFALVVAYTVLLMRRAHGGGVWETAVDLAVSTGIIAAGVWYLWRQPAPTVARALTPFAPHGLPGVLTAMGITFMLLQGFDTVATVAGEVKEPRRNLPRAMFWTIGIALAVYAPFLFCLATAGVPADSTIAALAARNPDALAGVAVAHFAGPVGFWLLIAAVICSTLAAFAANLLAATRVIVAMAEDGTLPHFLARTNPNTAIPVRAGTVVSGLVVLILLAEPGLEAAGAAASLIFLLSFGLTHVTCILTRWRVGVRPDAFRTPWFPLFPTLGLAACLPLAVYQGFAVPSAGVIAALWLALGFVLYFSMFSVQAEVRDAGVEAGDPELARLRGRSPLVLVPLANPRHARAMVEVAQALAAPEVGRVLLLSVVAPPPAIDRADVSRQVATSHEVVQEALVAALEAGAAPEALVTIAPDPWQEIIRVAALHRCESLLVGLSNLGTLTGVEAPLERLLRGADCDIVVLGTPPAWHLAEVNRILVPVAGASRHDRLRAQLLASLCRTRARTVTFLRVVPEDTADPVVERLRRRLCEEVLDALPFPATVEVVRGNDPALTIRQWSARSELTIIGVTRQRRQRLLGGMVLQLAATTEGAVILISRHEV